MDKCNEEFKKKVLDNGIFDAYDKQIIQNHLSNFYCVFQLGWDAHKESQKEPVPMGDCDKKRDKT